MFGELGELDRTRLDNVLQRLVDGRKHGQRNRAEADVFSHTLEFAELGELGSLTVELWVVSGLVGDANEFVSELTFIILGFKLNP